MYLRSLALLAEWEGNVAQAIAHLEEAHALAEAMGLLGERWQILTKLGELYQAQRQEEKAQSALRKTREIIQTLAAGMNDEALRVRFLAAPSLKRIGLNQI